MDNKELLQEVQTEMYNHLTPYGEYKNGWYEVVTPDREQQSKICAQIAQLHYEPILQAKNTTIKELEAELERLKGLLRAEIYDRAYSDYIDVNGVIGDDEESIFEAEQFGFIEVINFCKQHNITS